MIRISISTDVDGGTISRHIYGHFAEYLGRCIYDGIYVGDGSSIPNVRDIRTDIVEAMKRSASRICAGPAAASLMTITGWTASVPSSINPPSSTITGATSSRTTLIKHDEENPSKPACLLRNSGRASFWPAEGSFGTHEFMDL